MRSAYAIGAGACIAALTACAEEQALPAASSPIVVWADDDAEMAIGFDDTKAYEIWIADDTGASARRLFGPNPGSMYELYFMRSAGYLLVRGGSNETELRGGRYFFDRVGLDGTITTLFESDEHPGRVIPSPDGAILAHVQYDRGVCAELFEEGAGPCVVLVELWDSSTGEPIAPVSSLLFEPSGDTPQAFPDWVFDPEGHLLVSDGVTTYEVGRDGELVGGATAPACFRPQTSSSDISSDGRSLIWDRFQTSIVITPPEAPGYPARCFAE